MGMEWFRQQRHFLLRLSLALWLLALLVTAGQAWLQHCANAAVAIGPSLQLPGLQLCSWLWLLLLPALAQFKPARTPAVPFWRCAAGSLRGRQPACGSCVLTIKSEYQRVCFAGALLLSLLFPQLWSSSCTHI